MFYISCYHLTTETHLHPFSTPYIPHSLYSIHPSNHTHTLYFALTPYLSLYFHASVIEYHRLEGLSMKTFISHSSGVCKTQYEGSSKFCTWEGSKTLLLCPHMAKGISKFSGVSSIRVLNCIPEGSALMT